MKLIVAETYLNGISKVDIEHNGERLEFDVDCFKSASTPYAHELFDDANRLLELLGDDANAKLFSVYREIRDTFRDAKTPVLLHRSLKRLVKELYDHIPYERCKNYVYASDCVTFPTYLKSDYTETDRQTRDYISRTYLRDEYIDLVILALGYRFMVPVWGVHVGIIADLTANSFKEYQAFSLIETASIYNWPPRQRLDVYFEASIDTSKIGLAATIAMLDSVEVPKHLQALVTLRKLCLAPISYRNPSDDLVKITFNFGNGQYNRYESSFGGRVKSKRVDDRIQSEDDNSSVWDVIKPNQPVATGDKEVVIAYTQNPLRMAKRLAEDIDVGKLEACLDLAMSHVDTFEPERHQIVLTQMLVSDLLPAEAMADDDDFPHDATMRCLAVAQAVIWHWGFIELAILMQAQRIDDPDYVNMDLRSRVNRDLANQLCAIYPHGKIEGRAAAGVVRNPVIKSIDRLCDSILRTEWEPLAPPGLMEDYRKHNDVWRVPGTIKNQFAELIIHWNA